MYFVYDFMIIIIMASTVSLHTPLSILLSITLITFIGRPTVSVEAAKNHQELLTNSHPQLILTAQSHQM